jgi:hypothetical protein
MNMTLVLAAGISLAWAQDAALPSRTTGSCHFAVSRQSQPPEVKGPEEIVSRARVLIQPDSPVALLSVDLSPMTLTVGSAWFERSGGYSALIKNVSDRVLTQVVIFVRIRGKNGHIGSGAQWKTPLHPGETVRIVAHAGGGDGTAPDGEVEVVTYVDSVETSGCVYKPSQSWPALGTSMQ